MARVSHGLTQGDDYVLNTDNDVGLSACLALLHRQQHFWFSIKFKSQCDKTYQNLHRSISFLFQFYNIVLKFWQIKNYKQNS